MKRMLKIAAALFGALLLLVVFIAAQAWYYQIHIGQSLDTELGFTHGSPYIRCGDTLREVLTIHSVQPGGVFERAGFHSGDIVVGVGITAFYRTLHHGRGGELTVSVVDGDDGPSLSERRIRQIRFKVPEKP
jgi:hypothetical protein